MNENETTFENKASILSDLWLNYRQDEEFQDFVEYNDLGLPFAYGVSNNIFAPTDRVKEFIEEAFGLLIAGLGLEDTGFETLEDILAEV